MDSEDWSILFLLAVHNTSITLLLRYSRSQPTPQLNSTLLVCIVEAVKLVLASFFALSNHMLIVKGTFNSFLSLLKRELGDKQNLVTLLTPSIAYAIQNNLSFIAIKRLSMVEYQIGIQGRVVWTALASGYFLKRPFSRKQYLLLGQLASGIAMVQVGDYLHGHNSTSGPERQFYGLWNQCIGWMALLVATCAAGTSGVILEWVASKKQDKYQRGVWFQAMLISLFTLMFSTILYSVSYEENDGSGSIRTSFTWLTAAIISGQSIGGLLVAYVITNIGNVERILSSSIAVLLGFVCERIAFPRKDTNFLADAVIVVGIGCALWAVLAFVKSGAKTKESMGGKQETVNGASIDTKELYIPLSSDVV